MKKRTVDHLLVDEAFKLGRIDGLDIARTIFDEDDPDDTFYNSKQRYELSDVIQDRITELAQWRKKHKKDLSQSTSGEPWRPI